MAQVLPPTSVPSTARPRSGTRGWRRTAGRVLSTVAAAVAVAAGVVASISSQSVLVLGAAAASRLVLAVTLVVAGVAAAAGHGLSRWGGPLRDAERAVGRGVVVALAVLAVLGVPLVGFVALLLLIGFIDAIASPLAWAVIAVAIGVGAVVLERGEVAPAGEASTGTNRSSRPWAERRGLRRAAATLLTAGVVAVTVGVLGWGVVTADDDVVVAHDPEGCTAVVRETQAGFSGEAVLYVAAPGSVVAHVRATYPLEESVPFRDGDYVLETATGGVRIAFDDGRGGIDDVVPCR